MADKAGRCEGRAAMQGTDRLGRGTLAPDAEESEVDSGRGAATVGRAAVHFCQQPMDGGNGHRADMEPETNPSADAV